MSSEKVIENEQQIEQQETEEGWIIAKPIHRSVRYDSTTRIPKEILDKIVYPSHRLVAIVLGGLPGSGKTTVRNAIIDRIMQVNQESESEGYIAYNVVSTDDYVAEMADQMGTSFGEAYNDCRKHLPAIFTRKKDEALERGKSALRDPLVRQLIVIFDLTNIQFVYRSYVKEFRSNRFTVVGLFFSSVIKNTKVPQNVFERMKSTLQPPVETEGFNRLYVKKTLLDRHINSLVTDLYDFCPDLTLKA